MVVDDITTVAVLAMRLRGPKQCAGEGALESTCTDLAQLAFEQYSDGVVGRCGLETRNVVAADAVLLVEWMYSERALFLRRVCTSQRPGIVSISWRPTRKHGPCARQFRPGVVGGYTVERCNGPPLGRGGQLAQASGAMDRHGITVLPGL
jgi:hypothetical protein